MANKMQQKPQGDPGQRPRRRILRIGVLLGGKIVEERLIRDRSPVSIGQSSKNTFSIPLENLPREWTLFGVDNDHYRLQFGPKMDGRVSDGSQVYTFDQVKGGKAQQQGDHWLMPLSDQARGKVSIGDLTLLFQFVTEPPIQPKPMLPASVRGTMADRIDPRLAVIESITITLCMAVALIAWLHDRPKRRGTWGARTASVQEDVVDTIDPPFVQPDVTEPGVGEETKAEEKTPEKTPTKSPTKVAGKDDKSPTKSDPGPKTDATSLQEEAARYAAALASEGESESGVDGKMGETAPGGDLNQQIKETRDSGQTVKVGGAGDRGTKGGGDPRTGTGHGPKTDGPTGPETTGGNKEEKVPKGRIQVASKKSFDDSTLSADAVIGRIQSVYMRGLQRCYKELLKKDPTARGKVGLEFTVNESGRVTDASAKTDDRDLSSCIKGQMGNWSFPPPKDSDKESTTASFAVTLALQPE
jgi:hypothetical protein